ncbi:cytochrome P450 [Dactylonectria estremocensis]|uniref:Cytochrome P450 n=1 Tax=Dactylonectria estremocensis TaxID=1079267 RepID=A0A9P9IG08_9HYPO|nr:cytochrome P450 [Dactylonectria estremocensis]
MNIISHQDVAHLMGLQTHRLGRLHGPIIPLALACILVLVSIYIYLVPNSIIDPRRRKLPPGPKGWPLIGNLLDLADSEKVRDRVREWHSKYGDVFYTKIGATDYIWLSSPKAVKDLMDKKSAIYSSRPHLPLAQDVASGKSRQLFMAYGPEWRSLRKHSHALLNLNAAKKYRPVQDMESKVVLHDLLTQPDQYYTINRRYSTSVIMLVAYGYRVPSFENPLITKIFSVLENLSIMMAPGAFAVESFPGLAKLPQRLFGNWRSWGENAFAHDSKIYLELWETLRRTTDAGTAKDCFCKEFYLNDPNKKGIDDLLAAYTCGGLIEAGSETTATTINNWTLAMTLYPEVMKKGQEELDRVVGRGRLPQWDDEDNLPYIRAMIKETLRWRPVNKFGMYHASTEDDWYDDLFIPKNSVVVLNWWAIQRDPSRYPDPDAFDPARYLNSPLSAAEYMNSQDPYDRDHFSYGAGRRACPGVHLAEKSLFIAISRTLWGFNIEKKKGPDGAVVEPTTKMMPGFLSVPLPFECEITCRSEQHRGIIEEEFEGTDFENLSY